MPTRRTRQTRWDFGGRIGLTHHDSEPTFPTVAPPDGPDIVLVMLDDVGFADLGCFGAEVPTPNIDALAARGLRYNNFHTTTLCSPSRACLLTGRNHHSVGMRMLSNVDSGWPSGRGRITREAALVSEILAGNGYNTFAVGKWHVAPMRDATPGGPFDEWPLGRGFNNFYGFMNGATDQFHPELVRDNHPVDPPAAPGDGYHLTDDLVDQANRYVSDHVAHRPDSPFLLYLPLGAAHTPHQAPDTYLRAQRGRYDEGWDVIRQRRFERQQELGIIPPGTELPPSNPDVPRWDDLTDDERKVAARMMEAYAAFIAHTDAALGRLFSHLERVGRHDDTLVMLLSDNGAAMEGGRLGTFERISFFNDLQPELDATLDKLDLVGTPWADNHYATGWAQVSNTPLRWYKYHTHGGGVRDPLIVSWPRRFDGDDTIAGQFHHITDITPTLLEVAGIEPPTTHRGVDQMPMHGTSLAYTFDDHRAPGRKRRQYFEMFGNRGIVQDGWKAVTHHDPGADYGYREWELYHLDRDFSEAHDLAADEPERLRELVDLWFHEAGTYDVLPLDDRSVELYQAPPPTTHPLARKRFDYYPPVSHVEPSAAPPLEHHSHAIEAVLRPPFEGVVLAYGNHASGFTMYVRDDTAHYEYHAAGPITRLSQPLPPGDHEVLVVRFDLELGADRTGRVRLTVDDDVSDWTHVEHVFSFLSLAGMDVGRDGLAPVSQAYDAPFSYRGEVERVSITLDDGAVDRAAKPLVD